MSAHTGDVAERTWFGSRLRSRKRVIDELLDYGIFIALLGLCVFFSARAPYFLTIANVLNIGQAVAVYGIMAVGVTFLLIAGQVDLSITSVVALVAVIIAQLVHTGTTSVGVAVAIAMLAAVGVGIANSILVVNLGINSIIATIAMALTVRGAAYVISRGQIIAFHEGQFVQLANARPAGVPLPVIILAVLTVAGAVFLYHTKMGWHTYAIGGNPAAATRAGIPVTRIYRRLFVVCALLSGLAGLITTALNSAGEGSFAYGDEFNVLTGVLIGGIGLVGGTGRIERTVAGVLIIGVLQNGLVLMDVQSFYQQMITGGVFILAVVLDAVRRRRLAR